MRLPKTLYENSFDINFWVFISCELYVLLEFKYSLVVSGILTMLSIFFCTVGVLHTLKLKREDPEMPIIFDISKNIFLSCSLCLTWYILYDLYDTYRFFIENHIYFL